MENFKSRCNYKAIYNIYSLLCGLPKNLICSKCFFFTGPMPVTLDRASLNNIYKKEYIVLEKSDGTRYLLFLNLEKVSIIDRNTKSHTIFSNEEGEKEEFSCFDGELTFNILLEKYSYLIYDTGIIKGDWRISSWDFYSRLRIVNYFLQISFKKIYMEKNFFSEKLFFYQYNIKKIFEFVSINAYTKEHVFFNAGTNGLFHCNKNDGIIFSPLRTNYSLKTTCTTLKWKYEFENTMDLLIQKNSPKNFFNKNKNQSFVLSSMINRYKPFKFYVGRKLFPSFRKKNTMFKHLKKIGEFRYIQKKGSWVLKKHRFDKMTPNSIRILLTTFKIISESLNREELLDRILKFQVRKERGKCCEKY